MTNDKTYWKEINTIVGHGTGNHGSCQVWNLFFSTDGHRLIQVKAGIFPQTIKNYPAITLVPLC